jgi:alpha-ribazole phosphatase
MKLFLIRHTSVAIDPGICYGQSDANVALTFEEELKAVATAIRGKNIGIVFSSPLTRCRKLAESLFPSKKIVYDERLKELNFGDWEMQSWEDIYRLPEGKKWMDNYQKLPTLNGESYPEMVVRVKSFYEEVKLLHHKNVAIVNHAGVIRILKSIIENVPIAELFETFKPAYGSVAEFDI